MNNSKVYSPTCMTHKSPPDTVGAFLQNALCHFKRQHFPLNQDTYASSTVFLGGQHDYFECDFTVKHVPSLIEENFVKE